MKLTPGPWSSRSRDYSDIMEFMESKAIMKTTKYFTVLNRHIQGHISRQTVHQVIQKKRKRKCQQHLHLMLIIMIWIQSFTCNYSKPATESHSNQSNHYINQPFVCVKFQFKWLCTSGITCVCFTHLSRTIFKNAACTYHLSTSWNGNVVQIIKSFSDEFQEGAYSWRGREENLFYQWYWWY